MIIRKLQSILPNKVQVIGKSNSLLRPNDLNKIKKIQKKVFGNNHIKKLEFYKIYKVTPIKQTFKRN